LVCSKRDFLSIILLLYFDCFGFSEPCSDLVTKFVIEDLEDEELAENQNTKSEYVKNDNDDQIDRKPEQERRVRIIDIFIGRNVTGTL